MHFIERIFSSKEVKILTEKNTINIYLSSECKKSIEAPNQTAEAYMAQNQFEQDQFLYVLLKNKKTNETVLKRKLNGFEFLSDVLSQSQTEEYKPFIVIGYSTQRNTIPKINTMMAISQATKFIRSGTLSKFSESKNIFEDCQLRLHHDYLTYYKPRIKEKKVSFMPLQNASVEMISDKKHIFIVKDKFKSLMFKTTSKQDMIGWLLAINEAVRIRNAQIYMNELDEKLKKKLSFKVSSYLNKCLSIKDANRTMIVDEMGRKALRKYFKQMGSEAIQQDAKILSMIDMYLYMCKVRSEKGESESQQILNNIRQNIRQIQQNENSELSIGKKDLNSKQQLIKTIEEMMKYLDKKYKKILIEKKVIHGIFESHMVDEYKSNSRFNMVTLFGENPSN